MAADTAAGSEAHGAPPADLPPATPEAKPQPEAAPRGEEQGPAQLTLAPGAVPDGLDTLGWEPRPSLSGDENALDLALLLARSSLCRGGSMACLLSRPDGTVFACSTNSALTQTDAKRPSSDLHAEVNAIGRCARQGIPTAGCTAYITMPPCKKCFGVLVAAGVRRIVTRKPFCEQDAREMMPPLKRLGIPFVVVPDTERRRADNDRVAAKRKRPPDEEEAAGRDS
uniref:CMP/dCMP-type deaminase domain-containing protein n=1 Tax=Alexandrium monilatum TaxID=311494 RepID=A0A7S4VD70_9DINO